MHTTHGQQPHLHTYGEAVSVMLVQCITPAQQTLACRVAVVVPGLRRNMLPGTVWPKSSVAQVCCCWERERAKTRAVGAVVSSKLCRRESRRDAIVTYTRSPWAVWLLESDNLYYNSSVKSARRSCNCVADAKYIGVQVIHHFKYIIHAPGMKMQTACFVQLHS